MGAFNSKPVEPTERSTIQNPAVAAAILRADSGVKLDDIQITKIARQLDFASGESGGGLDGDALATYAQTLVARVVDDKSGPSVPKVRFGRTELMMPIVTCGGMRVQQTWCPDTLPIATSKISGIDPVCQVRAVACARNGRRAGVRDRGSSSSSRKWCGTTLPTSPSPDAATSPPALKRRR